MSLFEIRRSYAGAGTSGSTISGNFTAAALCVRGLSMVRSTDLNLILDNGRDTQGAWAGHLTREVWVDSDAITADRILRASNPLGLAYLEAPFVSGYEVSAEKADAIEVEGAANLQMSDGLLAFTVGNGGSGYTTPPTVVIAASGGGAATAVLTGDAVSSIVITNPGSYPSGAPAITFTGGGGSNAAATVTVSGAVSNVLAKGTELSFMNGKLCVKQASQRARYIVLKSDLTPEVTGNTRILCERVGP